MQIIINKTENANKTEYFTFLFKYKYYFWSDLTTLNINAIHLYNYIQYIDKYGIDHNREVYLKRIVEYNNERRYRADVNFNANANVDVNIDADA